MNSEAGCIESIRNTSEASRTESIYTNREQYVWHGLVNTAGEGGSHFKDFTTTVLGFPTEHFFFVRKLPFDQTQLFFQELVHPAEILS